jgi:hypothetical protein
MKKFFELNKKYKFEITDLTALIYLICSVGTIAGHNMTILFFVGSIISTAFCWQGRRLNLLILNIALLAMNLFYVINLFQGG